MIGQVLHMQFITANPFVVDDFIYRKISLNRTVKTCVSENIGKFLRICVARRFR